MDVYAVGGLIDRFACVCGVDLPGRIVRVAGDNVDAMAAFDHRFSQIGCVRRNAGRFGCVVDAEYSDVQEATVFVAWLDRCVGVFRDAVA